MPKKKITDLAKQVNQQCDVLDANMANLTVEEITAAQVRLQGLADQFKQAAAAAKADARTKFLEPFLALEGKCFLVEWNCRDYTSRGLQVYSKVRIDEDQYKHSQRLQVMCTTKTLVCGLQHPAGTPKRNRAASYGEQMGFFHKIDEYTRVEQFYDLTRHHIKEVSLDVFEFLCDQTVKEAGQYYQLIEELSNNGLPCTNPGQQGRKLDLSDAKLD